MQRICVFCGSSEGARPAYRQAAEALGGELARRGIGLVYGGASVGLMGAVADAALAAGGEVIGVIPRALFKTEVAHTHLTMLYEVTSMHERKAKMADLADAFIALPGGFGTFDELFEMLTWGQIGIHSKPIGLLDIADYFTPLLALMRHAVGEGFVPPRNLDLICHGSDPAGLLEQMINSRKEWEIIANAPARIEG
jgi:uncharacterized protein (TIGR00730 family)